MAEAHARLAATTSGLRVAVVQEWITARAGSEQVFEALAELFPAADLYALSRVPSVHIDTSGRPISTTFLDRPALHGRRAAVLPLMPFAWHTITRQSYDLVISSSHAFARWFRPARHALHLSYVHAPLRYAWTPEIDVRGSHPVARVLRRPMTTLDRRSVAWTDGFAANSTEVQERIQKFYGREATVIPPPVDTARFDAGTAQPTQRSGLLSFGRWIEYKRLDLVFDAAELAGERLTVAGRGPLDEWVRERARRSTVPVELRHSPSDAEVAELLTSHRALLFPGREDFGIVPVEAAAAGLPTIALARGGALDTVLHHNTGLLVDQPTAQAFAAAIERSRDVAWDEDALVEHAASFSPAAFADRVAGWVLDALAPTTTSDPAGLPLHRGAAGR